MFRGAAFRYIGGASLIAVSAMAAVQWTRSRYAESPDPNDGPAVVRDRAVPGTSTAISTIGRAVQGDDVLVDPSIVPIRRDRSS